ncbi:MAG: hypothetical protein U0905_18095 [Pirellulales bacterium]
MRLGSTGLPPTGRFFHRILPIDDDRSFAVIGGAHMEIGKFTDTARVQLAKPSRLQSQRFFVSPAGFFDPQKGFRNLQVSEPFACTFHH